MRKTTSPLLTFKPVIICFIMALLSMACLYCSAQAPAATKKPAKPVTYLLPDGSTFSSGKWDRLEQAWGKDRIMLLHSKEDDANGIVRLARQSDEKRRQLEEQNDLDAHAFDTMLNKPAPGFNLADIHGKHWSLQALRGKIVVLNFWFTTCTPCIQEMPELNKLVQTYNQGDVVFLALTFNDAGQVIKFLKTHTFSYTLLPGSSKVDEQYKITSWPTSMVICKKGNIKKVIQSGTAIRDELGAAIDALRQAVN